MRKRGDDEGGSRASRSSSLPSFCTMKSITFEKKAPLIDLLIYLL
jgi:hypothetical protein